MPRSLPGAAVAIKAPFLVLLTTSFTDKHPGLAFLQLYTKHDGEFLFTGMASFGFHQEPFELLLKRYKTEIVDQYCKPSGGTFSRWTSPKVTLTVIMG